MLIKSLDDYVDKVHEQFNSLSKKEIHDILLYGMRSYYMHNTYGADVILKSRTFTMYTGKMFRSDLIFYNYWRLKWSIKIRLKYKRNKTKYNGEYYFGLSEEQYSKFMEQFKYKNKRRVKAEFNNIVLYKILDEALLDRGKRYFFVYNINEEGKFKFLVEKLETRNYRMFAKRDKNNNIVYI